MNKVCVMAESEEVRQSMWDACEVKMDVIKRIDFFLTRYNSSDACSQNRRFYWVFFMFALYSCLYVQTQYIYFIYSILKCRHSQRQKTPNSFNNLTAQQHNGPLFLHDKMCGFPPLSSALTR